MQTLTLPNLQTLLRTAISLNEPVMVWGPPGCGKSETVAQLAASLDAELVDIRLSQYDSVDLRGSGYILRLQVRQRHGCGAERG